MVGEQDGGVDGGRRRAAVGAPVAGLEHALDDGLARLAKGHPGRAELDYVRASQHEDEDRSLRLLRTRCLFGCASVIIMAHTPRALGHSST